MKVFHTYVLNLGEDTRVFYSKTPKTLEQWFNQIFKQL